MTMTITDTSKSETERDPESVFARILVGVDRSNLSLEACRQALRLAEPHTATEAATVSLFPPAAAAALGVPELAERLEQDAGSALLAAREILGPSAKLRWLQGLTVEALLDEAKRVEATLLAIGAPENSRFEEMIFGGIGGELLHKARCSTLVARAVADEATFPHTIVVGIDGSEHADRAYKIAEDIATRRHSALRTIVALGGKHLDVDEIRRCHPDAETAAPAPVPALVQLSADADLLIVGCRGLHGPRALGSVSERVAHQAACSVLAIR